MKKYIVLTMCLQILCLPAYSIDVIEDTFVNNSLQKYKNQEVKIENYQVKDSLINSDFIEQTQKTKVNIINNTITDSLSQNLRPAQKISTNLNYDYQNINNAVLKIKIDKEMTTKEKPQEGAYVKFHTISDLKLANGQIIPKNTLVKGRVETVSQNDIMGVPAHLIIDNFKINGYENLSVINNIEKIGANRSLWVYPITYIGSGFFGVGLLFIPIRGGHAKISYRQQFELKID